MTVNCVFSVKTVLLVCGKKIPLLIHEVLFDCHVVGLIRMTFPGSKDVSLVPKLCCVNSCVLTATNFVNAIYDRL